MFATLADSRTLVHIDALLDDEFSGAHEWRAAEATQDAAEIADYIARSVHRGQWDHIDEACYALMALEPED